MRLEIEKLTIGELAKIEDLSGQSIALMEDPKAPKSKLLAALYFVAKKRENIAAGNPPGAFTWEQALNTPLSEIESYLDFGDDEPDDAPDYAAVVEDVAPAPARAEGKAPATRSRTTQTRARAKSKTASSASSSG